MSKISINDLAQVLVAKNGLEQKDSELFVAAIFDVIQRGLERDNIVKIKGFGTFKIIGVEARESVNVNTGERVVIESHGKITFTPDATMKELVNKPFSQFETVVLNDGIEFDDMNEDNTVSDSSPAKADAGLSETQASGENVVVATESDASSDSGVEADHADFADSEKSALSGMAGSSQESPAATDDDGEPNLSEVNAVVDEPNGGEETDVVEESSQMEPPDAEDGTVATDSMADDGSQNADAPNCQEPLLPCDERPVVTDSDIETEENETSSAEVAVAQGGGGDGMDWLNVGYEDEPRHRSRGNRKRWIIFTAISIILVVAAFAGGYLLGERNASSKARRLVILKYVTAPKKNPVVPNDTVAVVDTVVAKKDSVEAKTVEPQSATTGKDEPSAGKQQKKAGTANTDGQEIDSSVYEQMDVRVRTGAYRIVGTDYVRTVKSGETLYKIARQTLGEGMVCYIEVYNGLPRNAELKEGQKLKIPKLVLKGKKRN